MTKRDAPGVVTSPDNPKVKLIASLAQRKYRERHDLVLLEGERLIRQALAFGASIRLVAAGPPWSGHPLLEELRQAGAEVFLAAPNVLKKLSGTETPQGLVAAASAVAEQALDLAGASWVLVADRIQDPGNFGALLRTAVAAGVDGVACTAGTVDPKNPKAVRASAGAYFAARLLTGAGAADLGEALRAAGFRIAVADARGEVDAFSFDWTGKVALVVGNEGAGAGPQIGPTHRVRLPMPGGVESLNAAVAGSILIYEGLRRRTAPAVIYHITTAEAWEQARQRGEYRAESLAAQGFIHCSNADQVVRVANAIFAGKRGLVLLHVDPGKLDARVVYENLEGGTELFPHVYGPIPLQAVVAVSAFEPGPDGRFEHHRERLTGRPE